MPFALASTSLRRSVGFAVAVTLAVVAGCRVAPLAGVGRATDVPQVGVARADASAPDAGACPVPADFATRFARVGPDSFVAWGHAGRYAAGVYVTPEAKDAVAGGRGDIPAGSQIVMTSVERTGHKPGPTFFMYKEPPGAGASGASWRYGIVEGASATRDDAALCARCHAEAPHDHVFGLPE